MQAIIYAVILKHMKEKRVSADMIIQRYMKEIYEREMHFTAK